MKTVVLSELRPGMVIMCDVRTHKGMMLLRSGTEVTKAVIERLIGFERACMLSEKYFQVIVN